MGAAGKAGAGAGAAGAAGAAGRGGAAGTGAGTTAGAGIGATTARGASWTTGTGALIVSGVAGTPPAPVGFSAGLESTAGRMVTANEITNAMNPTTKSVVSALPSSSGGRPAGCSGAAGPGPVPSAATAWRSSELSAPGSAATSGGAPPSRPTAL